MRRYNDQATPEPYRGMQGARHGFQSTIASVARPRGAGCRPLIESQFEDGVSTQGVGSVSIFVARDNLIHALFEQVFDGAGDTVGSARVFEHVARSRVKQSWSSMS